MSAQITPGPYDGDLGSHQTPLYFGENNENLIFGCYHSPVTTAGKRPKDVGIVLCNPFGFEEVAAHRGLRNFALECSARGFPCMRFDYLGCGNSAEDEFADNLLQQWVDSIDTAIKTLKQLGSVEQIILIGFRFGFSLAALASVGREDILAMVAVSPVIRGRDYLRELRLSTSSDNIPSDNSSGIGLVPNGFIVSDATAADIQKVDLASIELGANRLLLIEELQVPSRVEAWSQSLQSSGTNIDTELIDGYLQLSTDPQTSIIPRKLFERIFEYVEGWNNSAISTADGSESFIGRDSRGPILSQSQSTNSSPAGGLTTFSDRGGNVGEGHAALCMKESIVSIPAGTQDLFGILHERTSGVSERAVIFLNAGTVRNIGPNRMFVPLAREWAGKGIRVLRVDFAGIGDSHSRAAEKGNASYSSKISDDLAAAVAFLRQLGSSEVILVGLCSGAYHAFRGAVAHVPVDSAILINPLAFDQQDLEDEFDKSYATYEVLDLFKNIKRQIRTREFWSKLRKRQLDTITLTKLINRRLRFSVNLMVNGLFRNLKMKHSFDIVQDLRDALGEGVALDFFFSESDPGLELLARRTGRTLAEFQKLKDFHIDIIPNADHTFTNVSARSRLVTKLNRLLESGPESNVWTDEARYSTPLPSTKEELR